MSADEGFLDPIVIFSAECVGNAEVVDGVLDIGGVKVRWDRKDASVYVRRRSSDLSVIEVHLAQHDGLFQEEMDQKSEESDRYPLGAKEYWRGEECVTGGMSPEEFELFWGDE